MVKMVKRVLHSGNQTFTALAESGDLDLRKEASSFKCFVHFEG